VISHAFLSATGEWTAFGGNTCLMPVALLVYGTETPLDVRVEAANLIKADWDK
jgi:hypothetical protein